MSNSGSKNSNCRGTYFNLCFATLPVTNKGLGLSVGLGQHYYKGAAPTKVSCSSPTKRGT